MKYLWTLLIFGLTFVAFTSYAQNAWDEMLFDEDVIEAFQKQTWLDQIEEITGIYPDKIGNQDVDYVESGTPSPALANIIQQLRGENGEWLPSSFKLFLTKTPKRSSPYRTRNACDRIANLRLWEWLWNAKAKAHFNQRIDHTWESDENDSLAGRSVWELVGEVWEGGAEALLEEFLAEDENNVIEVVTIPHYDDCGSVTKITWDPFNSRVIVVTVWDCQCKRYDSNLSSDWATLADYSVVLVAPVTTHVHVEKKAGFLWMRHNRAAKVSYKVGSLDVTTEANCSCSKVTDPPPPLPPKKEWVIQRFIWWITGLFGGSKGTWTETPPPPVEGETPPEDDTAKETETDPEDEPTEGSWDDTGEPVEETDPEDETPPKDGEEGEQPEEDTAWEPREETDPEDEEPLACGTDIDIDGRSNVPTFAYREDPNGNVNFDCDGTCRAHQVCKVVPESVAAFRNSCVYCQDQCPEWTYVELANCEWNLWADEVCVENDGCFIIEKQQPEDTSWWGNCEEAVRQLLDVYLGWFDPPVTFTDNWAIFQNGPHKCLSQSELDQYHIGIIEFGIQTEEIQSLCPTLTHVSTEEIGAGTCDTKTIFSF